MSNPGPGPRPPMRAITQERLRLPQTSSRSRRLKKPPSVTRICDQVRATSRSMRRLASECVGKPFLVIRLFSGPAADRIPNTSAVSVAGTVEAIARGRPISGR